MKLTTHLKLGRDGAYAASSFDMPVSSNCRVRWGSGNGGGEGGEEEGVVDVIVGGG